jgi:hypothetical protein
MTEGRKEGGREGADDWIMCDWLQSYGYGAIITTTMMSTL